MVSNQFFEKQGPFTLKKIVDLIGCKDDFSKVDGLNINGIESLVTAKKNDMTFLNSIKYKEISLNTKATACITSSNLSKFLPKNCIKINVKNVLFSVTQVSRMFYPEADLDYPDINLVNSTEVTNKYPGVTFGKNVLVGKNVLIGKNSFIGSNSIIESNVKIGFGCVIGNFVVIKNSLIYDNVHIKDGSKIGIKGFGFIPMKERNLRTPQIGKVVLEDGVEIGANCSIDRGSVTDTIVGKNTFLDNLVHIAHNVKIGQNCIFAAQTGVAGSTTIGNKVIVGGQGGISGHLNIGNNVKIGGGSAVLSDVKEGTQVIGNPAILLRDFVKLRKKT
tara:strand:- start:410 stop:1405 length:996 start_codon:yes stop_codon:yes gene_type:complete